MPAYLIVNYKVEDPKLYGEYASAAGPAMQMGEACQLLVGLTVLWWASEQGRLWRA